MTAGFLSRLPGLFLLALLLVSCDINNLLTPPPPDASGFSKLDVSCDEDGFLEYYLEGEPGSEVSRWWGSSFAYDPDFNGKAWGGSYRCTSAPERGVVESYLKRRRDGRWVRGWVEAGLVEGEKGVPEFRVLSGLKTELVEEADLPFEMAPDPQNLAEPPFKDRKPLPAPIWLPRAFCLQPEVEDWPWGIEPGNTNPHLPPAAPAKPPALYYSYSGESGSKGAFIEYINGKYVGAATNMENTSGFFAIAPGFAPEIKMVIYASWRAKWEQNYGRWVRIYTRNPIVVRMEGGRLVCENYRPEDWVAEMMPEGFNFPGFKPEIEDFDNWNTPLTLPAELDPYAGR